MAAAHAQSLSCRVNVELWGLKHSDAVPFKGSCISPIFLWLKLHRVDMRCWSHASVSVSLDLERPRFKVPSLLNSTPGRRLIIRQSTILQEADTMADLPLDYGSAQADASVAPVAMQDDAMEDATGATSSHQGSRFYALPIDQAVEAGAQRGPAPLSSAADSLDDLALMGQEERFVAQDPPAVESGSDIRLDTLLIEGLPITQLSTSRLFAYLTHFGAQPLGLEWIDDQRCKIVFADERSARLGLEYLCPPPAAYLDITDEQPMPLPNIETLLEYEPDSWHSEFITSLVLPRRAHRFPAKMYNHVERQAALVELEERKRTQEAVSSLPDDVPEIYREMEQEDRKAKLESREVRDLNKLRSSLWLRHAVNDVDRKESRASTKSQWYKRHGFEAGREIVPKLLQVGEVRESVELFPNYKPSESDSQARGGRDTRSMMDQLDSELDQHLASRDNDEEPQRREGEMMADAVQARGGGGGAGGGGSNRRRGGRHEESDLFDRVASSRNGGGEGGRRGRGRGREDESRSGSDGRWGHDAYDSLAADDDSRRSRRHHNHNRRSRADALDQELDEYLHQSHRREFSPGRQPHRHETSSSDRAARHHNGGGGGGVKMKGRGRMKAPGYDHHYGGGGGGGGDRWNEHESGSRGADGGGSLAKRMGGGSGRGDLRDRLDAGGGARKNLADRFS